MRADSARFRYCLLVFDLVTITFIIATSFIPRNNVVEWFDTIFGIVILADFSARIAISRHRLREFLHPSTWADIAAIISFLAPLVGEAAGFLRVLRTVRLLRSYQLLLRLRADFDYFRAHEEVILAATNLTVFVFVMTGFVYETEHGSKNSILKRPARRSCLNCCRNSTSTSGSSSTTRIRALKTALPIW